MTYRVESTGGTYAVVDGDGYRSTWYFRESAKAYCDVLNAETPGSARNHCSLGYACDRDRIHQPEFISDSQLKKLVLCQAHLLQVKQWRRRSA